MCHIKQHTIDHKCDNPHYIVLLKTPSLISHHKNPLDLQIITLIGGKLLNSHQFRAYCILTKTTLPNLEGFGANMETYDIHFLKILFLCFLSMAQF